MTLALVDRKTQLLVRPGLGSEASDFTPRLPGFETGANPVREQPLGHAARAQQRRRLAGGHLGLGVGEERPHPGVRLQ